MTARRTRRGFLLLAVTTILAASGCTGTIPRDAQGTLERASGGTLYVGATSNAPWTEVTDAGEVSGIEADLVADYAASIDARIEWRTAAVSDLALQMEHDELDLVIAGLTADTPWADRIAPTRPYRVVRAEDGSTQKRVIGVRPGENALQVSLERHLAEAVGELAAAEPRAEGLTAGQGKS
jgi:polar amino acid transport system substrate-binding protein